MEPDVRLMGVGTAKLLQDLRRTGLPLLPEPLKLQVRPRLPGLAPGRLLQKLRRRNTGDGKGGPGIFRGH